ncbi:ABC-F family ATP-binding cassette domain-containing protein [soil metagenome]
MVAGSGLGAPVRALGVTVSRGAKQVLAGVDLTVAGNDRIGVTGPNGIGKSTLLQVLAGQVTPDSGSVVLTPPSTTVGYLPQEPLRSNEQVRDALVRRTGVADGSVDVEAATAALAAGDEGADAWFERAWQRWMGLGGADIDARIGEVWAELGLDEHLLDQSTASLSGGEAARASLAALLLSRYDVYLLDEPTNDLDLDGLARLERWISELRAGVVLVSHDRTFLARTVTSVVEIDEFRHDITRFNGGWEAYLVERASARRHAWEAFEDYDAKRQGLAGRAQREREWASQGASKVKKSGETDKYIRAFRMNQTEQLAGRAARTERAMERLDVVDKPREPWRLQFTIGAAPRGGDVALELRGVEVEVPDPADGGTRRFRLGPIDLVVGSGERVALLGPNGSGKTTLLDVALGRRMPDAGSARIGPSVVVGEIGQVRDELTDAGGEGADAHRPLLRAFQDITGMDAADARTLLAKFGLVADHVLRAPATLSPGERTRASLALLMARHVNLLVLDEPTNHLDLPAIEQLEWALDAFAGTVVLVTHDRSLLDHVRLTRTIEMADGRLQGQQPRP